MRSGQRRLVISLTILTVTLAVIGVGSIAAYFILSAGMNDVVVAPKGSPREWMTAQAVYERLALLMLSGWPEQAVIDRCLAEGQTDTALVISIHGPMLPDRGRAGAFLRIGRQYASQGRDDLSVAMYRKVAIGAALSPELSDATRIELLAQAASGLIALQQQSEAVSLLDQAVVLVEVSPALKPAQRNQLADSLEQAYRDAGVAPALWGAPDSTPVIARDGSRAAAEGSRGLFPSDLPLSMSIPLKLGEVPSESFQNILTARRQAADQLVQFQAQRPGEQSVGLIAGLKDALLAEDSIVADLRADASLPATMRAELAIVWLTTKSQIARGMFGLSLVPEWEEMADAIDADLRGAWDTLSKLRSEEMAGAESALTAAATNALAGEWGLIPGYDQVQGAQRLQPLLMEDGTLSRAWILKVDLKDEDVHYIIRAP